MESKQIAKVVTIFLIITIILWITILLFQFRILNIFDKYLMKFPGPLTVFGIMVLTPILAVMQGLKIKKSEGKFIQGCILISSGIILFTAFVVFIGIPLTLNMLEPETPKNPDSPRVYIPQYGIPVFPGAEGFGTKTPAGRGGKVISVTSLKDNGPGTLREALESPFSRTIVFAVSGIIELDNQLFINHPFVTISGQTAPGNGVCIKNAGIVVASHDVLIQHIRVRPGNMGKINADDNDAISILGEHGDIDGAYNIVLDHISTSWGEDETISTWYGAHDITISWSIISEALNVSRHRKITHSAGLLIGDSSYNVSMHHNLLAHNDFRNPLIIEGGTHDFINNVVYNWGVLPAEIVDYSSNSFLNFIGNYFIPGPSTQKGPFEIMINPDKGIPQIYAEGNIGPHREDESDDDWNSVGYGYGDDGIAHNKYRSQRKFDTPIITTMQAGESYQKVLAESGAILPVRDVVDNRIVQDVINKTGSIINSPDEVGGYPIYAANSN